MSIIATNVSKLPIAQKLVKGQEFINLGTGNANVPGNAALIASLVTQQAELTASNAAYEESRQATKLAMLEREAKLEAWNSGVALLASFTESATGGNAEKITSAGFDVRAEPSPPQPVAQVQDVRVSFTGMPGYSAVRWKRTTHAEAYVLERSPEPITPTSWQAVGTVTETKYEGNGAVPGAQYWYRVAGVNRLGQGPWSVPSLRPVM